MSFAAALQVPYRQDRDGYWGDVTSTLNWCEEDYAVTYYIAEMCNTITNAVYLWLGYKGIRSCVRYGHPPVFLIAFVGYLLIGLGSILFHATLKYPMQLVDELSMIYTTCIMYYAAFSYQRTRTFLVLLALSLVGLAAFITAYYHRTQDPKFHQNAYGVLTASVIFWSMYVMERRLRPALEKRIGRAAASPLMAEMWWIVAYGMVTFLSGYLIWNLDNWYCPHILRWRNQVLLPWALVLEGHAWWHILTGIGGYYYILWGVWLHRCLEGSEGEYRLLWPSVLTSVAEVVRVEDKSKTA